MAKIIALVGASKAGKSEVTKYLVNDYGFKRMRFAGTLKEMLVTMGLSRLQVDGALKEVPDNRLLGGKTPRHAMQTLGTEWRNMISEVLWTDILDKQLEEVVAADPEARIVIEDCRFFHEAKMLREHGAVIWRVRRPSVEPSGLEVFKARLPKPLKAIMRLVGVKVMHESELYWRDLCVDREIMNDWDLRQLRTDTYRLTNILLSPQTRD